MMRISTLPMTRSAALPAEKDRLAVIAISVCLVFALISFGIAATVESCSNLLKQSVRARALRREKLRNQWKAISDALNG
jgi:hypothetical protein